MAISELGRCTGVEHTEHLIGERDNVAIGIRDTCFNSGTHGVRKLRICWRDT